MRLALISAAALTIVSLTGASRPVRRSVRAAASPRRSPAPHATAGLKVTAGSFAASAAEPPSGGDVLAVTLAPGAHELVEIAVAATGTGTPALAVAADARSGTAALDRRQFELVRQPGSVPAGGPARYWLAVQAPLSARPGVYRLPLRASAGSASRLVTVGLRVLPFELTGASKRYAIHFTPASPLPVGTGAAAPAAPRPPDPAQELRARLTRLRSRGIATIGFDRPDAELAAALETAQALRINGPYLRTLAPGGPELPARITETAAAIREHTRSALLWVADQGTELTPPVRTAVRESGGSLAVIGDPAAQPGEAVAGEIAIYSLAALTTGDRTGGAQGAAVPRPGWVTWDPASESPLRNRLFAGFLLWKSGLSGAYWRAEDSERFWSPGAADFLQLEGIGEGIDDARYLTVFYSLIRQVRDKDRRHPLPDRVEKEVRAAMSRLTADATRAQVAAARRSLIAAIEALQTVVR